MLPESLEERKRNARQLESPLIYLVTSEIHVTICQLPAEFKSGPRDAMNGGTTLLLKSDCRRMEGKFPYEPRYISEVM